ncbi:hypothetical protein [Streptomyces sp. NPDC001508]|uniref:hypothetical protein n=1 Tax=Streptomyces sp. NPDC001508 TaxID=3154656 RepID=UPI003317F81E
MPLDQAPIDHVTAAEWAARQEELSTTDAPVPDAEELEQGAADGCSPWACRGEADAEPTQDDFGLAS